MEFSYKIKRLLVVSVALIILALASIDSAKTALPVPSKIIPRSHMPLQIDPNVFVDEDIPQQQTQTSSSPAPVASPKPAVATISAEAYIVANLDTGQIYSEHNSRQVFPIASLSKLITALVAVHKMSPNQKITITQPMLDAYGDAGHLVLGETYTLSEIFYPLLLESSNDAAEAIAQSYGYDNFIQEMDTFAAQLGMTSTSFKDASGLSSGNDSNAHDLLTLARYIYSSEQPLLGITRLTSFSVASSTDHGAHTWNTINPFPFDPHFIGGKTGRTNEAKESMISMFSYTVGLKTYHVAIIVLRSDFSDREIDSSLLFERFIKTVDSSI